MMCKKLMNQNKWNMDYCKDYRIQKLEHILMHKKYKYCKLSMSHKLILSNPNMSNTTFHLTNILLGILCKQFMNQNK